ncbi:MAG TPA: MipA/OmpV family protein [Candidatus Omnitrophota bacterium]|nr:MipA/OmpV family protein [Candidatus Omnitrophota bacterium]
MKKIFVLLFLLFFITPCFSEEQSNYFGLGVMVSKKPYKDIDTTIMPIPIISWESQDKRFFIEGKDIGYKILRYQDLTIETILSPRFMGYDDKDADILDGMKDRKMSLDAGLKIIWDIPDSADTSLSLGVLADTLSVYQGVEIEAALSKKFKGQIFILKPQLGLRWQSKNLTDYYYGIRSSESTGNRPMYTPDDTCNYFSDLSFYLGIHKDWVLTTMLGYEYLGREITDSPLLGKKYQLTAMLGVIRKF